MKTLKELLWEKARIFNDSIDNKEQSKIIEAFKEWLTQKRPENFDKKNGKYYKGTQVDLNELLEELEK